MSNIELNKTQIWSMIFYINKKVISIFVDKVEMFLKQLERILLKYLAKNPELVLKKLIIISTK